MNGIKLVLLSILALCISTSVMAKAKITSLNVGEVNSGKVNVSINFEGELNGNPEISTRGGLLQVAIPDSVVWPKIEKKVRLGNIRSTLMAYQFDKNLVRFRALVPFSLVEREGEISLNLKDNKIIVTFPVIGPLKSANTRGPSVLSVPEVIVTKTKTKTKSARDYDEGYLETLLNNKKPVSKNTKLFPGKQLDEDKVAMALSGIDKEDNGTDIAVMTMVGKFAGFLIIVLGIFFMVVNLFKKGVMKKGKLGFLNNTDVVTILNTTYVGPKKSLMLVKVHKQVFLISNDEKGMNFLSEVNDTTGILKNGEEAVSGDNFDTNLGSAEVKNKDFKLKDISEMQTHGPSSGQSTNLASFLDAKPVMDQVKLSDQIKKKVKNLKALQ
ncbi:MAG: FliO/MopB family protein [Bacteriovoracaceae bacterium]|nr:FliO/MopB family protein [Bacteriovoracaceae bacterium]